jgi:hypothetical protein
MPLLICVHLCHLWRLFFGLRASPALSAFAASPRLGQQLVAVERGDAALGFRTEESGLGRSSTVCVQRRQHFAHDTFPVPAIRLAE